MWKTLFGRCLYRTPNNEIRVFDNGVFRWLQFDSQAIQTLLYKRNPQIGGLHYVKTLIFGASQLPGDCCIMGLGGAGCAHALSRLLEKFEMTAVESNSKVIETAKTYFKTSTIPNLKIVQADANIFVQKTTQPYRHIIIDLFDAVSFPNHCFHEQFFADCRKLLLPDGLLAINLANPKEQFPIFSLVKKQFGEAVVNIPVKHCANLIILASNQNLNSLLQIIRASGTLKSLTWEKDWGCVARLFC